MLLVNSWLKFKQKLGILLFICCSIQASVVCLIGSLSPGNWVSVEKQREG